MTLDQVINGLEEGQSFKRSLENDPGWEYVSPVGRSRFLHQVVGENNGGWGGSAELSIEVISNDRWAKDGWEYSDG
jgi:hypothetical protein